MRVTLPVSLAAVAMVCAGLAGTASASVPFFNATCGPSIDVHADEGGPIYVDGQEAKLKTFNDNYYEASSGRTTISVSVNPDGSVAVSYTGRGGANGMCEVNAHQRTGRTVQPPQPRLDEEHYEGVSKDDMPRFCKGEAAAHFDVSPQDVTTNLAMKIGKRFISQGWFKGGKGTTFFNCYFDAQGQFVSVN